MAKTLRFNILANAQAAGMRKLRTETDKLKSSLDKLDRKRIRIPVDLDDGRAVRGLRRLAAESQNTSKSLRLTQRGLASLVSGAAILTPAVAAAGAAVVAFGAVAAPSIIRVVQAQTEMGKSWDSLNVQQAQAARTLAGLKNQFLDLNRSIEPDALKSFNNSLVLGSRLLRTWTPLVRSGGHALVEMTGLLNRELTNPEWTEFFSFLARTAPSALMQVSNAALGAASGAMGLTQALGPLSGAALEVIGVIGRLVGGIARANPMLVQMVAVALLLRGPMIVARNAAIALAASFVGLETSAARAGAAMKLLGKTAVLLVATYAIVKYGEATQKLKTYADRVANSEQNTRDQISAVTKELERQESFLTTHYSKAFRVLEGVFSANYSSQAKAYDQAEALRKKLGELRAQRQLEAEAARLEADVHGTVSAALGDAADKTLTMENRVKALKTALDALFTPSIDVFDATTELKRGFDILVSRLEGARNSFDGANKASQDLRESFSIQLKTVAKLHHATVMQTGDYDQARAAAARQIPILQAMAGGSEEAQRHVAELATSLGITSLKSEITRKEFVRTAGQMGLTRDQARKLWNQYRKIPAKKRTDFSSNARGKPSKDVQRYLDKLDQIPRYLTTKVTFVTHGKLKVPKGTSIHDIVGSATGGHVRNGRIRRYADGGGPVSGPGGPTSDMVPAMLSNGEFVIRSSTVRKLGVGFFEAINRMRSGGFVKGFARGGSVSGPAGGAIPMLTGVGKGMASKKGDAVAAAKDLSKRVVKVYSNADTLLKRDGKDIVAGLSKGVRGEAPVAVKSSKDVSKRVRDVYKPAGTWLRPPGKGMVQGLSRGMRQAIPQAQKVTTSGVNGILDRWGKLRNTRNTARYVVNNVMAVLVKRFNSVAKSFGAKGASVPHFRDGGFVKARRLADGGMVKGPGGPREDKIPAMLSNGEFVVNAKATRANLGLLKALNKYQRKPKGDPIPEFPGAPGLKDGGLVSDQMFFDPVKWYRNQTSSAMGKLAQLTSNAFDRAMAKAPPKLFDAALKKIKKLYEEFGVGSAAAGLRFAQREAGKPYVWGGVGPRGYDCSGIWSAVTRVIQGYRNPHQRMFSTASFGNPAGYRRGAKSNVVVGVNPGSHMAGTIILGGRKFNIESGGTSGGVGVNGRAGGAWTRAWAGRWGLTRGGVKRAMGGMLGAGQWSWVGENGPEMIRLRHPGRVFSAPQSQRLMSSAGAGITIGNLTVYADSKTDGHRVGYEIVRELRRYQRATGQPIPVTVDHSVNARNAGVKLPLR